MLQSYETQPGFVPLTVVLPSGPSSATLEQVKSGNQMHVRPALWLTYAATHSPHVHRSPLLLDDQHLHPNNNIQTLLGLMAGTSEGAGHVSGAGDVAEPNQPLMAV